MGSHLQQGPHSDAHRLTRSIPKMILTTYKIDAHPVTDGRLRGCMRRRHR
jgi:hypothetical protein